ncbi:hypothetical protein AWC38_SpisGene23167 [Stylophora pistillata]|uniref:Uncharacterized protein n=1 Tax=Stylophora pistillata TaxID=50429 RepID=A0A2B4R5A0_STYPI|nr:hypothetical protein AWC38_SpisGene23167 [Stylophora pistillata]
MILPKPALSVMNDSLERIGRFADADTSQRIVNRVDLYLQDAEDPLSDYETRDIVEKRNEIFKAMLESTKVVLERKLSDRKDVHDYSRKTELHCGQSKSICGGDRKNTSITPQMPLDKILMTKRRVYLVLTQQLDVITTYVHLSDIKDKPLHTPHDLLNALFKMEREQFILELGRAGVFANEMPTGKFPNLQFDVSLDDVLETCKVSVEKIVPDTLFNSNVCDNVYFELRKESCMLLGWVQPKAWFNVVMVKNAENLAFRKRGNVWVESRSDQNVAKRYWSMEENGEMIKFYLHELVWTFINTKRSAYKRGTLESRTLHVYSSIGDLVTIGSQRTHLLLQVLYQPQLQGSYFYAPPKIQYIPLRNYTFYVTEIQISETSTNSLTQFDKGPSIVSLHFRKKKQ